MAIRKLDIVVLLVKDWPNAISWYTEKLGLKLLYKEDDDEWCQLCFPEGDAKLALLGDRNAMASETRCIPDILCENLDETVEELRSRGLVFSGDIRGGDEGFRIISLKDPEGNELQLYEWTS